MPMLGVFVARKLPQCATIRGSLWVFSSTVSPVLWVRERFDVGFPCESMYNVPISKRKSCSFFEDVYVTHIRTKN